MSLQAVPKLSWDFWVSPERADSNGPPSCSYCSSPRLDVGSVIADTIMISFIWHAIECVCFFGDRVAQTCLARQSTYYGLPSQIKSQTEWGEMTWPSHFSQSHTGLWHFRTARWVLFPQLWVWVMGFRQETSPERLNLKRMQSEQSWSTRLQVSCSCWHLDAWLIQWPWPKLQSHPWHLSCSLSPLAHIWSFSSITDPALKTDSRWTTPIAQTPLSRSETCYFSLDCCSGLLYG